MKIVKEKENKGFEIVTYYPKEKGNYTEKTGKIREVIQCANVGEVAQWFARNAWAAPYGDSNYANPTVWYNGTKWCFTENTTIPDNFYYKGFVIVQNPYVHEALDYKDAWHVFIAKKTNEESDIYIRSCETYEECIERIDNQTI